MVDQHVLGLQVALDHVVRVQLTDRQHALRDLEARDVLVEALAATGRNVLEQLAARAEVHDEADLVLRHEAVVHAHEEGVLHLLQQAALVLRALDLLELLDVSLGQRLECVERLGLAVHDEEHVAVRALAHLLDELEVLDAHGRREHLLLVREVALAVRQIVRRHAVRVRVVFHI